MRKTLLILIIVLFASCDKVEEVKPLETDPSCLCNPDDYENTTDKGRGITIK